MQQQQSKTSSKDCKKEPSCKIRRNTLLMFSVTLMALLSIQACRGKGPKIDVCLSDPHDSGMQCVDKAQKPYFKPYTDTENYVCLSPSDAEALLNYCSQKK